MIIYQTYSQKAYLQQHSRSLYIKLKRVNSKILTLNHQRQHNHIIMKENIIIEC